jgi:hypothetical protein
MSKTTDSEDSSDAFVHAAAEEQPAEEDMDLRESLAALSRLTLGQQDLTDMLARVADFAARDPRCGRFGLDVVRTATRTPGCQRGVRPSGRCDSIRHW